MASYSLVIISRVLLLSGVSRSHHTSPPWPPGPPPGLRDWPTRTGVLVSSWLRRCWTLTGLLASAGNCKHKTCFHFIGQNTNYVTCSFFFNFFLLLLKLRLLVFSHRTLLGLLPREEFRLLLSLDDLFMGVVPVTTDISSTLGLAFNCKVLQNKIRFKIKVNRAEIQRTWLDSVLEKVVALLCMWTLMPHSQKFKLAGNLRDPTKHWPGLGFK